MLGDDLGNNFRLVCGDEMRFGHHCIFKYKVQERVWRGISTYQVHQFRTQRQNKVSPEEHMKREASRTRTVAGKRQSHLFSLGTA